MFWNASSLLFHRVAAPGGNTPLSEKRRSNCSKPPAALPIDGLEYRMIQKMKPPFWRDSLALELCFLLVFGGFLPVVRAQNAPGQIDIVVVEGEGASVAIRQHPSQDPAVRVEDEDHRPLANVAVVFTLPLSGASGEFANGSKTETVLTDQNGVATARGIRTNDVPGKLQIYVTAAYRGQRAKTLINMAVEAPAGAKASSPAKQTARSSGKWKWIVLGVAAAAGAGAGAYFYATRSSSGSAVSISAGSVVFGNPR